VVFPPLGRLAIKVIVDLSVQNALGQRLFQLVEKAVLVENVWPAPSARGFVEIGG
jgi:hypothetical protein